MKVSWLTSVYNLTQMYEKQEEMDRFLNDMARFLGYGTVGERAG